MGKKLTGKEWYERFVKELYQPRPQQLPSHTGDSVARFYRDGGVNFMYKEALEAAKRAGELEEAK